MQYFAIILSLAAAASAIDIRFYDGGNCDRGWLGCANIGPDNCCTSEAVHHPSVGFAAIPRQWTIGTQGFINGGCRDLRAQENLFNVDFGCLHPGGSVFTGAKYFFRNKRSAAADSCVAEAGQTCETPLKPNVLGLGDGQKYHIAGMEGKLLQDLVDFAFNGTVAADIPPVYEKFEIEE